MNTTNEKPKFTWQEWVDTLRKVRVECLARKESLYCFFDAWEDVTATHWQSDCESNLWRASFDYFRYKSNRTPENINRIFDSSIKGAIQEAAKMGVIVK